MTPPLRTADDRAALLAGLTGGGLDTLASDQCHLRLDRDKLPVQGDFTRVPTGLPGIGARLPLGFALGGRRLAAAERLVEAACEAPARIFGLDPRKGAVVAGSDADLVVWDPAAAQHDHARVDQRRARLDAVRGFRDPGTIRHVFARGDHVVSDVRWQGDDHAGSYLPVERATQAARSQS